MTRDPIITERSLALIGSFLLVFTLQMCLTLRDGLCGVALTRFYPYRGHVRTDQAGLMKRLIGATCDQIITERDRTSAHY